MNINTIVVISVILYIQAFVSDVHGGDKIVFARGSLNGNKVEIVDLDDPENSQVLADIPLESDGGQAWMEDDYSSMLLCGGRALHQKYEGCANPKCYRYYFAQNEWSLLKNQPPVNVESFYFTKVPGVGNFVLGGLEDGEIDDLGNCLYREVNTSRIYTADGRWIDGPISPVAFYSGCAIQLDETTTWMTGNNLTYTYDWNTNVFTELSRMPDDSYPIGFMACAWDPVNAKIVLAGGLVHSNPSDEVKLYDPSTDTWSNGPKLPFITYGSKLTTVGNRLILSGGRATFGPYEKVYSKRLFEYSQTNGWTKLNQQMKYGRAFHNALSYAN